ncbi:hypothetical protein [Streptomyces violascens]|uniref:hypothetical protein n=1 Tax=Streptomyces violascens TaxID=67381 RepID=UPI0036C30707
MRVREMLSYLAVALPASAGAQARLLALQCALRTDRIGQVRVRNGLLRALRMAGSPPWEELERSHWLLRLPGEVTVQLLDPTVLTQTPGRPSRLQAADWALRTATGSVLRPHGPDLQLAAVALLSYSSGEHLAGRADVGQLARACARPESELPAALEDLRAVGLVSAWDLDLSVEEARWRLLCAPATPAAW